MKSKVKNNREQYISRASLHHLKDTQTQDEKSVEIKTNARLDKYLQAVIEENWYINFNTEDDRI